MAIHLTMEQLERYRGAALPFAELLAADEHLESCSECRRQMQELLLARGSFPAHHKGTSEDEENDPHLTYELKAGFIRGTLDPVERETVELHKQICEGCADELESLAAFAHSMLPLNNNLTIAAPTPTALERLSAYLRLRKWLAAVVTAALALVGIALGAAAYRNLESQQSSLLSARTIASGMVVALAIFGIVWVLRVISPRNVRGWLMQFTPIAALLALVVTGSLLFRRGGPPQIQIAPPTRTSAAAEASRSISSNLQDILRKNGAETLARPEKLVDGKHTITVTAGGQVLGLDYLPGPYQDIIAKELTEPLSLQSSAEIPVRSGESNGGFAVISPANSPMESVRPTFRWTPVEGAAYSLHLYNATGLEIRSVGPLAANEWTPSQPLTRGAAYQWRVAARSDGKTQNTPAPTGKMGVPFRIISSSDERKLAEVRTEYSSSHLLLGIAYEQLGIFDQAEAEFADLERANPDSPLARQLAARAAAERARQLQ